MVIEQFQACLVRLGPATGAEVAKPRPSVIVSPDKLNRAVSTVIIALASLLHRIRKRISPLAIIWRGSVALMICISAWYSAHAAVPSFSDASWSSLNPSIAGVDGSSVNATAVDAAGNLFVGGDFRVAGGVIANRIAKWNGSSWSALGLGLGGTVNAVLVIGEDVYVGGAFTSATNHDGTAVPVANVARWNGTEWSNMGSGLNGAVHALIRSGQVVYAGGTFSMIWPLPYSSGIAKWDGTNWAGLGTEVKGPVYSLAWSGSELYAGGSFTQAGNTTVNNIGKWDGTNWSALNSGVNGPVHALAVAGSNLYVGGAFVSAATNVVNRIAKWSGNGWLALGSGMNDAVRSLTLQGEDLYAGGAFYLAGGTFANFAARWDGTNWSSVGSQISSTVRAMTAFGGNLFVGGEFSSSGNAALNRVARWDGNRWLPLGSSLIGQVNALAVSGSDVYATAYMTAPEGGVINQLVRWNGSNWSAATTGLSGSAYAMAVSGDSIYVGGYNCWQQHDVVRWDGSNWAGLGAGMAGGVISLAVSGNDLYAGGNINWATNAGGSAVPIEGVAKWDGTNWSRLGRGLNGLVYALAVSGTNVYVGGSFTIVSNNVGPNLIVNRIARWDGTRWWGLGGGVAAGTGGSVSAIALNGNDAYVGGTFLEAYNPTPPAIPAYGVAKWNGTAWAALGAGPGIPLTTLAFSGNDLYAGGSFSAPGGFNRIAKWDGHAWTALGSGANGTVRALAVSGNGVYAAGDFTVAGGKVSGYAAKWTVPTLSFNPRATTVANGLFQSTLHGPESNTVTVESSTDLTNWIPFTTNILPPGGWQLSLPMSTNSNQLFRARFLP